jgi:hypothetical protein
MKFWLVIEMIYEEPCSNCGRMIKAGEKASIRVWWAYKEDPQYYGYGAYCEECKKV